jgi:hypothetical protein
MEAVEAAAALLIDTTTARTSLAATLQVNLGEHEETEPYRIWSRPPRRASYLPPPRLR